MLTYASEAWILTNRERKQMTLVQRKVYRRIPGLVYDNEILTNKEIYAIVKKPTVPETVSLGRLCWFGQIQRMEESGITNRVLYMNL
jgi:hypothetical protein